MEGNYYCFERSEKIDLKGMKIYIAGKITGVPDYKERFAAAEKYLQSLGAITMIPSVLPVGYEQHEYLHICFNMIDVNDAIYFLENWKDSPGAKSEFVYGVENHKLFLYESQLDPAWKLDNTVR